MQIIDIRVVGSIINFTVANIVRWLEQFYTARGTDGQTLDQQTQTLEYTLRAGKKHIAVLRKSSKFNS